MKTKPVLIQSDNGTEFNSKEFRHVLDKHDVRHVTVIPGDHNRQSIVERFNRTLESTIAKYQNSRNTNKYIDALEDLVHNGIKITFQKNKSRREKDIESTIITMLTVKRLESSNTASTRKQFNFIIEFLNISIII